MQPTMRQMLAAALTWRPIAYRGRARPAGAVTTEATSFALQWP